MSGAYCEGCGEGELLGNPGGEGLQPVRCDLCGWTADAAELGRAWLSDEGPPWTKRERKKAGSLFFLWVDVDPKAGEATFDVMHVLGLNGMSGSGSRSLIELETKPAPETLDKLRAVTGVTRVWLAP